MLLDLQKVFADEKAVIPFSYSLDLSDLEIANNHPFISPVLVQGQVKGFADAVLFEAQVEFDFSIPCDRCADLVCRKFSYRFSHQLVRTLNDEDNDLYIQIESDHFDVDELIRADILLELPSKFLCKPDCKGLCEICGVNWNKESCDCHKHQIDPRMEVLKQLID